MSNEYQDWKRDEIFELKQELDSTKKTLDESEHCCTEWEKRALDYKAENIKLSTALDVAVERLKNIILDVEVLATPEYLADRAKETLDQINEIKGGKDE